MHLPESLTFVSSSGCVYLPPTCNTNDFGDSFFALGAAGVLAAALTRITDLCQLIGMRLLAAYLQHQ
ncbi:TPA: hypothetical protein U5E31_003609 [Yersinia enterocolitica]|uniref:hypothetical protein n=1 Tax=Yersinia enterocolitica TaxID=630 RepID=UPI0029B7EAF9|nr:hypothetical protein [Yersinia enterocolitica]HEI6851112.1 hypothetical protein [Yersinia enterocolitica]HEN3566866.1 hypothetical protein [Yersinia enterocolitica]HEN3578285.1 hypothetical protein [Yersinia enterocolitica]HEN3604627.1 hypothetical protein [Yersinia enterocolitica]